jgi:hypothetical protein
MAGIGGYDGWRWIFILEGLFTFLVAVVAFWVVPDWPETAKFLKPEERELLVRRLAMDVEDATMSHWNPKAAKRTFGDVKIYLGSVVSSAMRLVTRLTSTAFSCTWAL